MPAAWIAAPLDQPCARTEDRINSASIGRWFLPVETTEERHGRKCIPCDLVRMGNAGLEVHHLNTGTPVKPAQPRDQSSLPRQHQEATARSQQTDVQPRDPRQRPDTCSRRAHPLANGAVAHCSSDPAGSTLTTRHPQRSSTNLHLEPRRAGAVRMTPRTPVPVQHGTFSHCVDRPGTAGVSTSLRNEPRLVRISCIQIPKSSVRGEPGASRRGDLTIFTKCTRAEACARSPRAPVGRR